MAKQTINNGETGLIVRGKLNDMFTEVYTDVAANTAKESNDTDANLRARSTHTGTQIAATISDFATTVTATKLDDFAAPDDNTDLNVSTTAHGLTPKAPNDTDQFLRGDGAWAVVNGDGTTSWGIAVSDETSDLAVANGVLTMDMPFDFEFTKVYATVATDPTGAALTVDVNDEGTLMLNAVLTIAVSTSNVEVTSFASAATSYTMTKGDKLSVDINQVGSTVAGAGLKLIFTGYASGSSIQDYKDLSLAAGAWRPDDTNPPEFTSVQDTDAYAFDATTEEALYFSFQIPDDYNGGVFRWRVDWDAVATASGTAVFGLSGGSFGDSDALSTALGTERTITDTLLTVGDRHKSPNDGTGITLAGSPVAGDWAKLKLVVKTSGTIAVDVLFLNLQLQYQTKAQKTLVWS